MLNHEGIIRIDFTSMKSIHSNLLYGWIDLQIADAMNKVGITKDQFPGTTARIDIKDNYIEVYWQFNETTRLNALVYTESNL